MSSSIMRVEVICMRPGDVWRRGVEVAAGTTLAEALEVSGIRRELPQVFFSEPAVGVFGRLCSLQQLLQDGDRVEVYRPLTFDPMESRRRRAQHRKRKAAAAA